MRSLSSSKDGGCISRVGSLGRTDEFPVQNAEFENSCASSLATEACHFNLFSCLKINSNLIDLNVMTLEKAKEVK